MASGYDGTIRIDSQVDTKGFNQGVAKMGGGLGSILGIVGKLGAAIGAAFAVGKLIAFGKESLIVAANYLRVEQAALRVGATMGIAAEETSRIVKELRDMGIQGNVANEAFINFARNGLDTSLLPALARGSQDLNAFADSGVSSSEVFDRLLTGVVQLSPLMLRTAGVIVDMSEANRRWAEQNKRTVATMTDQEKQAAALEETIRQLQKTEGLYEMSQRTAAGQMSSNKRIMSDFMAAVGGPFQNALYIFVLTINQMVKAFTLAIGPGGQLHGLFVSLAAVAQMVANAFRAVAEWVASIFGITLPAIQGIATTGEQAQEGLGGAAGAAEDLADATGDAQKAAKGALAAFDELNVLQMEDKSGGGGTPPGGGGLPGGGGVPFTPFDTGLLDEINAKVAEFSSRFQKLMKPVTDAFDRLKKALIPLGQTIWSGLKWAWDNIIVPFGTWVFNEVLPRFLDILAAGATVLNEALIALAPMGEWLWTNFLQPLAQWAGDLFLKWLDQLILDLQNLGEWIKENPEKFRAFAIVLGLVALGFLLIVSPVAQAIAIIAVIVAVIVGLIALWPKLKDAAADAWEKIVDAWEKAGEWFDTNVVQPITEFFRPFWEWLSTRAGEIWEAIKTIWEVVSTWFDTNVIQPLTTFFSEYWLAVSTLAENAWNIIKLCWEVVSKWFTDNVTDPIKKEFEDKWTKIQTAVTTVWDEIKKVWEVAIDFFQEKFLDPLTKAFNTALTGSDDGLGKGGIIGVFQTVFDIVGGIVKGIANSVISVVNGLVSGVIGGLNNIIRIVNNIGSKVPGWQMVPELSVPAPIPYLARGAVIPPNAKFLAMLGDQRSGRNLEAPENLIRQIVREESGGGEIVIRFEGSMSELVRQLKPALDKEHSRIGKSLVRIPQL